MVVHYPEEELSALEFKDSLPVYGAKEEDLDWEEIRRFLSLSKNVTFDMSFLIGIYLGSRVL